MKKQILILALLLAGFANVNMSFGQAIQGSVPRVLSCNNDALHPLAGKEYTYSVITTPGGGQYTWWATTDPNFISTDAAGLTTTNKSTLLKSPTTSTVGTDLVTTSTSYGVTTADDNVKITWSTNILAGTSYQGTAPAPKKPTFVAVLYTPPTASGCADNLKIYELDPKNGFTVDILNLDAAKDPIGVGAAVYDQPVSQCFANVSSAKYNAGKMDYLYGINTMYYEVVAANFTGSWTPTFKLTGLDAGGKQTAVIEWSYTKAFDIATTVTVTSGSGNGTYVSPSTVSTTLSNTYGGISIYIRVTITNNSYEGLSDATVRLAVDGTNAAGELDVVNATCVTPGAADFVDYTDQILKLRPTVTAATTSAIATNIGFIPKN